MQRSVEAGTAFSRFGQLISQNDDSNKLFFCESV